MNTTGRDRFKRNKIYINVLVQIFKLLPRPILIFIWNSTANHSQLFFVGIRYVILRVLIKSCGNNVKIGTNVQILGWENLSVGSNVSINSNCYIDAHGEIEIGSNVSIAHNSTLVSTNHDWKNRDLPIKYNTINHGKVKISDDIWIGAGSRILAGVCIQSRSIIAAGAVVNKNVQANIIVGGVPARKIKDI